MFFETTTDRQLKVDNTENNISIRSRQITQVNMIETVVYTTIPPQHI